MEISSFPPFPPFFYGTQEMHHLILHEASHSRVAIWPTLAFFIFSHLATLSHSSPSVLFSHQIFDELFFKKKLILFTGKISDQEGGNHQSVLKLLQWRSLYEKKAEQCEGGLFQQTTFVLALSVVRIL